MLNVIVKDGAVVRFPATINSLKSLVGDNIILPKNPALPITAEGYTLLAPVGSSEPDGDVTKEVVPTLASGQWTQAWEVRAYNEGELASQLETSEKARKLTGVLFEGVMCSATKEDMWGLNAVNTSIMQGSSETFRFDNGNSLLLTPANATDFMGVWVPFRRSFF